MTLPDVKICGIKSKNKREYPIHVLQEALDKYEGHPVYLDHVQGNTNRKYIERVGHISNPQIKADGIYATLNVNPHHQLAESIWYDFTNNTKKIGISQVVDAEMDGGNKVTKILDVKSIDIVNNPATTYSLKEEIDEMAILKNEIAELRKELAETKINNSELKQSILSEIENVKPGQKPVAIVPMAELPKTENLVDWVSRIKRNK